VWLVDPASDRVVRFLRLGRETTSIAFGGGAAWIGAFASEREILSTSPLWTGASWLFSVRFGAAGQSTLNQGCVLSPGPWIVPSRRA
jgi:hypothetical protein